MGTRGTKDTVDVSSVCADYHTDRMSRICGTLYFRFHYAVLPWMMHKREKSKDYCVSRVYPSLIV